MRRNREDPIGYKVSFIQFNGNGSPTAASNDTTAAVDIVSNPDLAQCSDGCFRPAGLAWDSQGRLFFSSDATGEIYVITREDGSGVSNVSQVSLQTNGTDGGSGSGTETSATPSATASGSSAAGKVLSNANLWFAGSVAALML